MREEGVGLEHDAALPLAHRDAGHVGAVQPNGARFGREETRDQPCERGLTAAARTDTDDELAGLDGEIEGEDARLAAGIAKRDTLERDRGHDAYPPAGAWAPVAPRVARAPDTDAANASARRTTVAAHAKPVAP